MNWSHIFGELLLLIIMLELLLMLNRCSGDGGLLHFLHNWCCMLHGCSVVVMVLLWLVVLVLLLIMVLLMLGMAVMLCIGSRHRNPNVCRFTVDGGMETSMLIGRVLNDAFESVRIDQLVASVHDITVTRLLLRLDIAGMLIVDAVRELIMGRFAVMVRLHWNCTDRCHQDRDRNEDKLGGMNKCIF